jgi:hypothetical protein
MDKMGMSAENGDSDDDEARPTRAAKR